MSDYATVKAGGLKIKGKKNIFKADKKKKAKSAKQLEEEEIDTDQSSHGGWWRLPAEVDLKGGINVAFEAGDGSRCYIAAMDNGRFTLGAPHPENEGPNPEEVFALIRSPDEDKFSLKTGYGKFIGVDMSGELIATAEAIGNRERFITVFENGKCAIQSLPTSLFLSWQPDREGYIYVASRTASTPEIINIRTNHPKTPKNVDWRPEEDKQKPSECETSYVKMFQHSRVDLKHRHVAIDVNDKRAVKRAQREGNLHEMLLERRKKTKSDRYC